MTVLIKAFVASDAFGQAIVVFLIVLSFFTISKMLWKRATLAEARHRDAAFVRKNRQTSHPAQLQVRATNGFLRNMPMAAIYQAAAKELLHHLHTRGVADGDLLTWPPDRTGPSLPESEMASVRAAAEGALSTQLLELESGMTFLATCTGFAPSLGLLGTVWGILRAFMDMVSGGGSINLATVAPGIASALLTTVAGLVVSLPCSIGYNFLSESARRRVVELENFTDGLLADILRVHGASAAPAQTTPAPVATAPVVIQTAPAAAPAPWPTAQYPYQPQTATFQIPQMPQMPVPAAAQAATAPAAAPLPSGVQPPAVTPSLPPPQRV